MSLVIVWEEMCGKGTPEPSKLRGSNEWGWLYYRDLDI